MKYQSDDQSLEIPNALYKLISLIAGFFVLLFSAFNFFVVNQVSLALIEVVFGLSIICSYWVAKYYNALAWHLNISLLIITFVALYAFYIVDLRAGAIYWLLLLPPMYCLLSGPKTGFFYVLTLYFPISYILFIKSDIDYNIPYRSVINFTMAYFLSYASCAFYKTQDIKHRQLLHDMAFQDPLTGSKNRHALKQFFDHFSQKSISSTPSKAFENTQLLLIDIDHFKKVNDEFGHAIGDNILVDVAELFLKYTSNQNVYRIGGEEFLIILNDHSFNQAYDFAENIRSQVESTIFRAHGHNITVTVSIGLAQLKKEQDFREFLSGADKNLYSAKHKGRNAIHYDVCNELSVE